MDTLAADHEDAGADSGAERAAWAAARRRIEHGGYSVGPSGRRPHWPTRAFEVGLKGFALGVHLAGLYGRGRRNALAPRLTAFELSFPALPAAFDGYRILQVSDTHLDALPELAPVAREILAGIEVDMLALTGDILADFHAPLNAATGPLMLALDGLRVRDRRLAILGNHDRVEMADALEALGFEVLLNRTIAVGRGGEHIAVTGLDDVHSFYTEAAHAALFAAAGDFRIALIHSPEMADHAAAAGVSLYLCGHTHGGQVCLPGGRPILTRLTRCRHAAVGLWREGSMQGYTSHGLGTSAPTLRFNSRGEMTVITLRRAA